MIRHYFDNEAIVKKATGLFLVWCLQRKNVIFKLRSRSQ